ncbi:Solute carrier family 43 member 3 [Fasciola hepatica]|uniref:Solute carrier family 43 member 3 n=1 Tax=Fasciola hepatica TaxID=6192 RepID=A0A4E0R4E6_FASHE|nr:Solute carrier family 43 member 3 [Fasciola hepatica]
MGFCERLDTCFRSKSRRWLSILLGIIEIFWFSGYFYGFNALNKPYQKLGVFDWLCNGSNCDQQSKMFSYAFIVASVVQLCLSTCTGLMLDKVGLRTTKLFSVSLMFVGGLMYAFTRRASSFLLFIGGPLVSWGSLSSLLCNYSINVMFPRFEAIAVSLLAGAYDSSSAIPFIISKAYPSISIQTSFLILSFVGLVYGVLFALFFLTQYSSEMGKVWKSGLSEEDSFTNDEKKTHDEPKHEEISVEMRISIAVDDRYPTLKSCIQSWPFALVCVWFMLGLLRFTYFLSQLSGVLKESFKNDTNTADDLLDVSSAFSMCGFLVAPLTGTIMSTSLMTFKKKISRRMQSTEEGLTDGDVYWTLLKGLAPVVTLLAVTSLIISCIIFVQEQRWIYYVTFTCLIFMRSILFSSTATMVITAFPQKFFGTMLGVINGIGGAFSLIQYGLLELPLNISNSICVAVSVITFFPPLYIFIRRR